MVSILNAWQLSDLQKAELKLCSQSFDPTQQLVLPSGWERFLSLLSLSLFLTQVVTITLIILRCS